MAALEIGELTVESYGCRAISFMRFLFAVERAEIDALTVHIDRGEPPTALRPPSNALEPSVFTSLSWAISVILALGRWAQIVPLVVGSVSVLMVNLYRQFSGFQLEYNSMRKMRITEYRDDAVPLAADASSLLSRASRIPTVCGNRLGKMMPWSFTPPEYPCLPVVREALAKIRL